MISPAAACHAYLQKTGPAEVCDHCEFEYTIHVTHDTLSGYWVKVVDTLPAGVVYISSSDSGVYDPITHSVTWKYAAGSTPSKDLTVKVKSTDPVLGMQNIARSWVAFGSSTGYYNNKVTSNSVTSNVIPCTPSPEFPSVVLPAGMVCGCIGAVLVLRRK